MSEEQTVNIYEYISFLKENSALKSEIIQKLEEKNKLLEEINRKFQEEIDLFKYPPEEKTDWTKYAMLNIK